MTADERDNLHYHPWCICRLMKKPSSMKTTRRLLDQTKSTIRGYELLIKARTPIEDLEDFIRDTDPEYLSDRRVEEYVANLYVHEGELYLSIPGLDARCRDGEWTVLDEDVDD